MSSNLTSFEMSESFEHETLDEKGEPYKIYNEFIKIYGAYDSFGNLKECWLQVEIYAERKFYGFGIDRWFEISFSAKLPSFSVVKKLESLIEKSISLPTANSLTEMEVKISEGNYYGREFYRLPLSPTESEETTEDVSSIWIRASPKEIAFIPISNQNQPIHLEALAAYPIIFYSTADNYLYKEISEDRKNYNKLLKLFQGTLEYLELVKYSMKVGIDLNQFNYLNKFEYGEEILKHLLDCAKCMEHGILHPALSSFVHAIEWALITGLKVKGKDIIKEEVEKKKRYYNLLDLIEESHRQGIISDKMYDRLKNFNQTQRRWAAHHKTGDMIGKDIKDVTELFEELMKEINPHLK